MLSDADPFARKGDMLHADFGPLGSIGIQFV
jgi:hypothetical protein